MTVGAMCQVVQRRSIAPYGTDLGLAKGTIERAYDLLEADTVSQMRGREGSFVLERAKATKQQQAAELDAAAESLVMTARQLGADEAATLDAVRQVWRNL